MIAGRPLSTQPSLETMPALRKLSAAPGLELTNVEHPKIGPGDVLIAVRKAGLCGTDLHIYEWDSWAKNRITPPLTAGHEFMGTVAALGADVTRLSVGDRVSAEGHIACGICYLCRTGQAHICPEVKIIGVDRDGAFARHIAMPQSNVWKLDPAVPDDVAAVFDPLGNAVHTIMTAGVSAQRIAITGVGSIGLMAIPAARAAGASLIIALDLNRRKLELARELGADQTILADDPDAAAQVRALTSGLGVDVLLEMSGSPAGIDVGLASVRNGGRAALLGIPSRDVTLNLAERVIFKGLTLYGINGRRMFDTWYQMEDLVKNRRLDLSAVITHVLPLEDYERGFALLRSGEAAKVVFDLGALH